VFNEKNEKQLVSPKEKKVVLFKNIFTYLSNYKAKQYLLPEKIHSKI